MGAGVQQAVTVRELCTVSEFEAASELYRRVFGLHAPSFAVNPRLMSALRRYGGSVIGAARPSGELVGFGYGFTGSDPTGLFHYSQAVVVADELRGTGVGRRIKEAQREVAIRNGLTSMRWAYDPWMARNGHFNLDVLGAVGRRFYDDFYDAETATGQERSPRLLVEWRFADRQVPAGPVAVVPPDLGEAPHDWGRAVEDDAGRAWIPIPNGPAGERSTDAVVLGRGRLAHNLGELLGAGFEVRSCPRYGAGSAAYLLARPEEDAQ